MTHLKKTRSMLAATALLCGLSPATSAMGQTYSYPAGTTRPSTIGVFQQSGTTNISGGPTIQWGAQPRIIQSAPAGAYSPGTIVTSCAPGLFRYVARPPLPPTVYCLRQAAASSPPPQPAAAPPPPPRPPRARDVGYGVPYTNGPCASTTSGAVMSPCVGRTGSQIQLRLTRPLPAAPGFLFFSATPSRYVGAGIRSGLVGSGSSYTASVPAALCLSGGGTWNVYLRLATGQDMGLIGSYTPNNCA